MQPTPSHYITPELPPHLVDPQLAHNDVMDGGGYLAPGIMALTAVEHQVTATNGIAHKVLATELGGNCVFLPQCPLLVFRMHRKHGRMVAYLRGGVHVEV